MGQQTSTSSALGAFAPDLPDCGGTGVVVSRCIVLASRRRVRSVGGDGFVGIPAAERRNRSKSEPDSPVADSMMLSGMARMSARVSWGATRPRCLRDCANLITRQSKQLRRCCKERAAPAIRYRASHERLKQELVVLGRYGRRVVSCIRETQSLLSYPALQSVCRLPGHAAVGCCEPLS